MGRERYFPFNAKSTWIWTWLRVVPIIMPGEPSSGAAVREAGVTWLADATGVTRLDILFRDAQFAQRGSGFLGLSGNGFAGGKEDCIFSGESPT